MVNLFAYGTLTFPEVWRRVVGRNFETQSATLAGFAVYCAVGDVYPVMIAADEGSTVEGLVYRDLDAATVRQLDTYESQMYERRSVAAELAGGGLCDCQAYVLQSRRRDQAGDRPWSAEWFKREALAEYLMRFE